MIRKILTTYAARLDEYLARSHRQPEGVAEVGLSDGGYMQRAATGYAGRRQPLCTVCRLYGLHRVGCPAAGTVVR